MKRAVTDHAIIRLAERHFGVKFKKEDSDEVRIKQLSSKQIEGIRKFLINKTVWVDGIKQKYSTKLIGTNLKPVVETKEDGTRLIVTVKRK